MADTGNYGIISTDLSHNSIIKFYEVAQRREFARKFQFKIQTLGPLNEDDLIYFTTANVPARSISNHTVPFIGLQYNIPGAAQYDGSDSWQVTFRCDEAANIRAKLLAWQDEIFNIQQTGGKYGVPNEQAKVIQLRVNAIVDMAKNVEDCYSNINSLIASLAKYTQTSREYWIQYTSSLT